MSLRRHDKSIMNNTVGRSTSSSECRRREVTVAYYTECCYVGGVVLTGVLHIREFQLSTLLPLSAHAAAKSKIVLRSERYHLTHIVLEPGR